MADHDADPAPGDAEPTAPPTPWPFVIAFGLFVLLAFVAYRYLEDDPGRLVGPDRIAVVDEDTVSLRFDGPFQAGYATVTQVGYALGDERITVELVLDETDCGDDVNCGEPTRSVTVEAVLPQAIEGRKVVAGTGRALLDCVVDEGAGTADPSFRCG